MVVSTFITNKASSHRQMDAAGVDGHVGTLPTLNMNKTPVRANKADRRNTGEPRETGFSAGQVPLTQNVEADSKSRYANHGSHPLPLTLSLAPTAGCTPWPCHTLQVA